MAWSSLAASRDHAIRGRDIGGVRAITLKIDQDGRTARLA
jgi:hypothetical protein